MIMIMIDHHDQILFLRIRKIISVLLNKLFKIIFNICGLTGNRYSRFDATDRREFPFFRLILDRLAFSQLWTICFKLLIAFKTTPNSTRKQVI